MSTDIQAPMVGPKVLGDGAEAPLRAERTNALVVQHAHGEMYEEVSRGNVWTISTAAAGVAIVTSVGIVGTAANTPIVGLFNQSQSLNCHITRAVLTVCTGTVIAGGFVWAVSTNPTGITSAGVNAINNKTFVKGGHVARAFDGSAAVTGQTVAPTLLRQFGTPFPGAIAAGQAATIAEQDDDLVVGPGNYLGLYAAVGATGLAVVASLSWAEIPT